MERMERWMDEWKDGSKEQRMNDRKTEWISQTEVRMKRKEPKKKGVKEDETTTQIGV